MVSLFTSSIQVRLKRSKYYRNWIPGRRKKRVWDVEFTVKLSGQDVLALSSLQLDIFEWFKPLVLMDKVW